MKTLHVHVLCNSCSMYMYMCVRRCVCVCVGVYLLARLNLLFQSKALLIHFLASPSLFSIFFVVSNVF